MCCAVHERSRQVSVAGDLGRCNTYEVGTLKGIFDLRRPDSADAEPVLSLTKDRLHDGFSGLYPLGMIGRIVE